MKQNTKLEEYPTNVENCYILVSLCDRLGMKRNVDWIMIVMKPEKHAWFAIYLFITQTLKHSKTNNHDNLNTFLGTTHFSSSSLFINFKEVHLEMDSQNF